MDRGSDAFAYFPLTRAQSGCCLGQVSPRTRSFLVKDSKGIGPTYMACNVGTTRTQGPSLAPTPASLSPTASANDGLESP